MNKYEENNLYKTSDLGLITALSLNFPVKEVDCSNPRKVVFAFEKTPELEKFINSYWQGEVTIEPQRFINQIKTIKGRIYESC